MSDNNQDKPDDYDAIFGDTAPNSQELLPFEKTASSEDLSDDLLEDMSETDPNTGEAQDYLDIDDGDEGIFAPATQRTANRKKSTLIASVLVLAAAGTGGYFFLSTGGSSNQAPGEMAAAPESIPPVVNAEEAPKAEPVPPEAPVAENTTPDTPPQDVVENKPNNEVAAAPADAAAVPPATPPEMTAEAEAPVADMTAPEPVLEKVEEGSVPQTKIENEAAANLGTPSEKDASEATAAVPVSPEPAVDALKENFSTTAPTDAGTTEVAAPTSGATAVTAPPTRSAAANPKPVVNPDATDKGQGSPDKKLEAYFDAPSGKIVSEIPAPSMNVNKGNNESIIIVNKAGKVEKAVHVEKNIPSKSAAKESIKMQTLDSKIVTADRALSLGSYDAASAMYEDLYKINPNDSRVLLGRAIVFQKSGNDERAIAAYEELLKTNPDSADAAVNLAGLIRKKYPAEAMEKLLDLHKIYPDNPVVVGQLGVLYADTGDYKNAFYYLSQAASIEPKNPLHYYNMAVTAEKAGDIPKAIESYEKSLDVDAVYGAGKKDIAREVVYDRLIHLRDK